MRASLEFLLGLLQRRRPCVAHEDFAGPHGGLLGLLQGMGIVARRPGANPCPGCPHCGEGVPYPLGGRLVCTRCASTVDLRHLLLWPLDAGAFLTWLARELGLRGGVRAVDESLWQLGTWQQGGEATECFYPAPGPLSAAAARRLAAYRNALLLCGLSPPTGEAARTPFVSLLEVLRPGEALAVVGLGAVVRGRDAVRFDAHSGVLWAGDARLGEVTVGSKEFHFLDCLARNLDRFVPYEDLKRHVLRRSGGGDETEEATFCQKLKSRAKKKIPRLDRLIATTNKADGYRLRARSEGP
jgi:hypothetical protein